MEKLVEIKIRAIRKIDRQYLREMSKDMVRKDFELIRFQDGFLELFKDAEFFSHFNDDLLSVKHCLELASGDVIEEATESRFWGVVFDAGISVAFDYKTRNGDQVKAIKKLSSTLVDLIFDSCEQESEMEKQRVFIEGFEMAFPHLSIPFMERVKTELNCGIMGNAQWKE